MIFICPVKSIGNKEITNLILLIIENVSTPVRMLTSLRIRILIKSSSIKSSKTVSVFREMSRNPVNDHTDSFFMHIIYKSHEVLWRTITGCWCKITCDLITPGRIIRMFHNRHKFDIVITHV